MDFDTFMKENNISNELSINEMNELCYLFFGPNYPFIIIHDAAYSKITSKRHIEVGSDLFSIRCTTCQNVMSTTLYRYIEEYFRYKNTFCSKCNDNSAKAIIVKASNAAVETIAARPIDPNKDPFIKSGAIKGTTISVAKPIREFDPSTGEMKTVMKKVNIFMEDTNYDSSSGISSHNNVGDDSREGLTNNKFTPSEMDEITSDPLYQKMKENNSKIKKTTPVINTKGQDTLKRLDDRIKSSQSDTTSGDSIYDGISDVDDFIPEDNNDSLYEHLNFDMMNMDDIDDLSKNDIDVDIIKAVENVETTRRILKK